MPKNPPWTRDELILALDLYFEANPLHISKTHPKILALSDLLNRLPIHPRKSELEKFRNSNGVYMKLCNFLRLNPSYGKKGLRGGGKLEERIWDEFATNRTLLSQTADAISKGPDLFEAPKTPMEADERLGEEEFPEGKLITMAHRRKERNRTAARKKKEHVLRETGKLACEVCRFEFESFYGALGQGIIECHHDMPLADAVSQRITRLSDLSLLCANCHRVIHRIRPWLSVGQLRGMLNKIA